MELDLTQSNLLLRKSIKRYLKKYAPEVIFFFGSEDTSELDEWCTVKIGNTIGGSIAETSIIVYCCTKNDEEFMDLSRLADKIIPLFSKENVIPFIYLKENEEGEEEWNKLMNIYIDNVVIGGDIEGASSISVKMISVRLKHQMKE